MYCIYHVMCMKKKRMNEEEDRIRTNITLSREVFNMAVDYKINLSSFLENHLINYFNMRHQLFPQKIQYPTKILNTSGTHTPQTQPTKKHVSKTALPQERCGYRDSNPSDWLGKLQIPSC